MQTFDANSTHSHLYDRFLAATRRELETELLSKINISRSESAIVFEVPGWGTKAVHWADVRLIVQGQSPEDGLDGLCKDVVAAVLDGVDVVQ